MSQPDRQTYRQTVFVQVIMYTLLKYLIYGGVQFLSDELSEVSGKISAEF